MMATCSKYTPFPVPGPPITTRALLPSWNSVSFGVGATGAGAARDATEATEALGAYPQDPYAGVDAHNERSSGCHPPPMESVDPVENSGRHMP